MEAAATIDLSVQGKLPTVLYLLSSILTLGQPSCSPQGEETSAGVALMPPLDCPPPFKNDHRRACIDADRAWISAGKFLTGCAEEQDGLPETWKCPPRFGALRRAALEGFAIDRHEVSVEAYAECVNEKVCREPSCPPPDPSNSTQFTVCHGINTRHARLPITGVDASDAAAYCAWRGGRLPSSQEWEKAARGVEGAPFPWGVSLPHRRSGRPAVNAADHTAFQTKGWRAVDHDARHRPVDDRAYNDGYVGPWPVDYQDDEVSSPFGLSDTSGNVFEWTGTRQKEGQVIRGGGYASHGYQLRVDTWDVVSPQTRQRWLGFRCLYPR